MHIRMLQSFQWPWTGFVLALWLSACTTPDPHELAISRGQAFLSRIQQPDGAICDTTNPLFDVWETVEAALALSTQPRATGDSIVQRALTFLQHAHNAQQLLCHNRACQAETCVETSAEYLTLLARFNRVEAISAPFDTLASLQLPAGNWLVANPDVLTDTAFPSVTGFALNAMREANAFRGIRLAGEQWLIAQQLPQGHWGQSWEYYGCTAYALWANLRALQPSVSASEPAIQKAKNYILQTQLPDGSWDDAAKAERRVSPALQTALMLSCLDPNGSLEERQAGEKAVSFLLAQQGADGNWPGGFFPIPHRRYQKEEYVFATARAIIALDQWRLR